MATALEAAPEVRKAWKALAETYLRERSNLKAVVVIVDIRRELAQGDLDLLVWLKAFQIQTIIVITKVDKISRGKVNQHLGMISNQLKNEGFDQPLTFSAKTGQGKQELWKKINEIV